MRIEMGCGSSKDSGIVVVSRQDEQDNKLLSQTLESKQTDSKATSETNMDSTSSLITGRPGALNGNSPENSSIIEHMDDGDANRLGSARSKMSDTDSGLGEEYARIITENSDEDARKHVESSFQPVGNLGVSINKHLIFCSVLFCFVLLCSVLFYSALLCSALPCPALLCPALPCPALPLPPFDSIQLLSCPVLSCSVLFYFILLVHIIFYSQSTMKKALNILPYSVTFKVFINC